MLEDTRKRGASVLIYLVFGTLIAVFIINFGPQSQGSSQGCGGATAGTPVTIADEEVSRASYVFLYQGFFRTGPSQQRAEAVLDALTRRELLAQEAEARGLRVTDDLVDDAIKNGWIYGLLRRESAKPDPGAAASAFFTRVGDDVFFDYESFKRWTREIGLSVGAYKSVQKREMLAVMMADMLKGSAQASYDEAFTEFLYENTTVTFDAVAFSPVDYRAAMKLTDADIARFATEHAAEIEAKYKADERLYQDRKPELDLQWIHVAKAEPAQVPGDGSGSGAGSGSGTPVAANDANKDKLVAARADILAKKKTFTELAKTLNADEADRANAGVLGWRSVETPKLGDPALNAAMKGLEPGAVSEVITTDRGHYLVTARARREGTLTFDQVKSELAADMARDVWSREAAKRAAIAALAEARGGGATKGKNLDQMFEQTRRAPTPGGGFEDILNNPNLTDDQKRELLQKLMEFQQQQGGGGDGQSGAITVESSDIPAKWGGSGDRDGSGADDPGSATAGSGASGGGSSTGSGGGSSAGSGGGGTPTGGDGGPTTGDDPVVEPPLVATKDQLPAFGPVTKPTVTRLGPVPKTRGELPDIGTSKPLVKALFDELAPGALADKVYTVGDNYVIVQLADKQDADAEKFKPDAEHRIAMLKEARGAAVLRTWLKTRCDALHKDGKIQPELSLLKAEDDQGNPLPVTYQPCNF